MPMVDKTKVNEMWQELRELAEKAKEATKYLDGRAEVVVESDQVEINRYLTNQFGENIVAEELIQYSDGHYHGGEIMCMSSSLYGLGTCRCISHEPWEDWEGWGFSKARVMLFEIIKEAERKIEQELGG